MVLALYAFICVVWGSTWLVLKWAMAGVPPFLAAGVRFTVASLAMYALLLARRKPLRMDRDDKIAILSSGVFGFSLNYALIYWAEQYMASGLAAILFSTMPLFVALLSRFWTRAEHLDARKLGGIVSAMIGTAVLFAPSDVSARGEAGPMIAVLVSSLFASLNLVQVKRHGHKTDVYWLNALGMTIGAATLLLLSALTESGAAVVWTASNVSAMLYCALAGSVATFLSYYWLIKHMPATRLSLIWFIVPIIAVWFGWAVEGEAVTGRSMLGMAGVLGGVAMAILPARLPRKGPSPIPD